MTLQAQQFFPFQSSVLHIEYIFYSVSKAIQTHEIDCFATSLLARRPWRFSLHHLKRTSSRAVVFSVLGMPRNHMALSPGYLEDVVVLSQCCLRHLNSVRARLNSSLHLLFCEIPGYPPGTHTAHLQSLCHNVMSAFEGDVQ